MQTKFKTWSFKGIAIKLLNGIEQRHVLNSEQSLQNFPIRSENTSNFVIIKGISSHSNNLQYNEIPEIEVYGCSPVDCKWSEFDMNVNCSSTCGVKSMTYHRTIDQKALYGGKNCDRTNTKTDNCEFYMCAWHIGIVSRRIVLVVLVVISSVLLLRKKFSMQKKCNMATEKYHNSHHDEDPANAIDVTYDGTYDGVDYNLSTEKNAEGLVKRTEFRRNPYYDGDHNSDPANKESRIMNEGMSNVENVTIIENPYYASN